MVPVHLAFYVGEKDHCYRLSKKGPLGYTQALPRPLSLVVSCVALFADYVFFERRTLSSLNLVLPTQDSTVLQQQTIHRHLRKVALLTCLLYEQQRKPRPNL